MLPGKDRAPRECKNTDTPQSPKVYEIRVRFAFYGGCVMGTLCFDGPRSESLPPPSHQAQQISESFNSHHSSSTLPKFRPSLLLSWKCCLLEFICFSTTNLTLPLQILERFLQANLPPNMSFSQISPSKDERILAYSIIYSIFIVFLQTLLKR